MIRKRVWPSALLATAVAVAVAAGIVAQAASPGATIKVAPSAAITNPPTSVVVTVTYSCLPSAYAFGAVNVDQSQANGSVSGGRIDIFASGYFTPTCDGKAHKAVVVASQYYYDQGTFVRGLAGVSTYVSAGAVYASTEVQVKLG